MTGPVTPAGHDSKPKCGGKKRQSEGFCTRPAGWGTSHPGWGSCKLHGGSTKTQVIGAERERVEAEARLLFAKAVPDAVPVSDPLSAYASFAGRVMAWLDLMDSLLGDVDSPRYRGATSEQVRGEVVLFERAMDRANVVLATYAKLNIDERLVRVTERQVDALVSALEAGLAAAGITGLQAVEAKRAASRHLRALSAAPPDPA